MPGRTVQAAVPARRSLVKHTGLGGQAATTRHRSDARRRTLHRVGARGTYRHRRYAPAARRLAGGNAPIRDALRRLAERTGGGERARELLSLAVIDIAGGAIRRRLLNGAPISADFEADVLAAVVAVLDRIALS
ncbi:hypothetical protein A4G29_03620 [Mycobacterium kansasii]|nr:hypothetical protein A4G29_03620 [Mycobacterium kansasii]